jgi:hypothetical protein
MSRIERRESKNDMSATATIKAMPDSSAAKTMRVVCWNCSDSNASWRSPSCCMRSTITLMFSMD